MHNSVLFAAVVVLLLAAIPIQAVPSLVRKSATFDEASHLSSAYEYLVPGVFQQHLDHPPLADQIAAFPLLFLKLPLPTDEASQKAFAAIWGSDRTLLEKVTDTLILGDVNAAKLMADVRDPRTPAPTSLPSLLKDSKVAPYLRANLALAYAKELSNRRVFDECLEAGTARLVGTDPKKIEQAMRELEGDLYRKMAQARNPFGDGRAAARIVKQLGNASLP